MSLLAALGLKRPKSMPGAGDGAAAPPLADAAAPPAGAADAAERKDTPEIAALRKRFDALAPRIAAAGSGSPVKPIGDRQTRIAALRTVIGHKLDGGDLKGAEVAYSELGAALDTLEQAKRSHEAHVEKRQAAKAGPVKAALALKLEPAALAATRTKAMSDREAQIVATADAGRIGEADRMVDAWITECKAWADAKSAYDNLNSSKPKAGRLDELADAPGGGAVLDALVAALPDTAPKEAAIAAVKARFDIMVEQLDRRKTKDPKPGDKSNELDPEMVGRDLKGLYKVLGKEPIKDVKQVEKIERYTDADAGGASFHEGVFTDTVRLYCGRPDDANVEVLGKPGQVVPFGEKVQPGCEPVTTGPPAQAFDFATLHEVGHAVDAAQGIMKKGRSADAGWAEPSVGDVADKIAGAVGYDAGYIKSMLESSDNTPPKEAPKPPKGVTEPAWEKRRQAAITWCADIRVGAKLWDNATGSKLRSIGGIVYHESYAGDWVSYKYAARAQGISGYQFRSHFEWFAELYAAYHCEKLNPSHPATKWLAALKSESLAG